jgi:hypothetical protein
VTLQQKLGDLGCSIWVRATARHATHITLPARPRPRSADGDHCVLRSTKGTCVTWTSVRSGRLRRELQCSTDVCASVRGVLLAYLQTPYSSDGVVGPPTRQIRLGSFLRQPSPAEERHPAPFQQLGLAAGEVGVPWDPLEWSSLGIRTGERGRTKRPVRSGPGKGWGGRSQWPSMSVPDQRDSD